jgi:aldehyde:ferredoxin oxidoreductase
MQGWIGRAARVDLGRGRVEILDISREILEADLGGRGLAGRFLEDRITPAWDDPDSWIALCAGPLAGTAAPGAGLLVAGFRSPLTGAWGDAALGFRSGAELKRAGLDALLITGRSSGWTALVVEDGDVRLEPAADLVGLGDGRMVSRIASRLGTSASWVAVGPAAEAGVRFASLITEENVAEGRCGAGLALAAKGVKIITFRGAGAVQVQDPSGLQEAREAIVRLINASPALKGRHGFSRYGEAALFDLMDARRMTPTGNFRATRFEHAARVNAAALQRFYDPSASSCPERQVGCPQISRTGEALPGFDALSHFTALVGNADLQAAVQANTLCNHLGMDPISAASALACHQEATGEDLPPKRLLSLLRAMGDQSSRLGRSLGEGGFAYASGRGRPEFSMSVKGLDLPACDPRGAYGMALGYAVSTIGGCRVRANTLGHEILRKPVATDRFSFSGKARIVKLGEDAKAATDSLAVCGSIFLAASLEEYAKALQAATGSPFTAQRLMAAGERICYRERIMNARLGFDAGQDDLPERFFIRPGSGDPELDIPAIDRQAFLEARMRYYRVRGLDESGRPTAERARRLGLDWRP